MRDDGFVRFRPALTFFLFLAALTISAQTTEADLSAKLVGKPLFLRGFWADNKLRFDATGTPQGHPSTASFTVAGVRLDKVHLSGDTLRLEGVRECLLFEEDGVMERATLTSGKDKKPEELRIEIKGQTGQDFAPALHAIFSDSLVELIPTLPPFWQRYARANFTKPQEEDDPDSPKAPDAPNAATRKIGEKGTLHVGGNVKPPKVIHTEDPRFTEYARRMRYSGKVEVYLWAEEDGSVSHVSIAKPAGLGLDEAAVAAVMKYRFAPATQNEKPVKVDLYIDVNFQIF